MSDLCLDDCYDSVQPAMGFGLQSHDVKSSCFDDFHLYFCIRSSSVVGLAGLTMLLAAWHIVRALHSKGRPYRLVFFLFAALEVRDREVALNRICPTGDVALCGAGRACRGPTLPR